jgi:hypothetical protein
VDKDQDMGEINAQADRDRAIYRAWVDGMSQAELATQYRVQQPAISKAIGRVLDAMPPADRDAEIRRSLDLVDELVQVYAPKAKAGNPAASLVVAQGRGLVDDLLDGQGQPGGPGLGLALVWVLGRPPGVAGATGTLGRGKGHGSLLVRSLHVPPGWFPCVRFLGYSDFDGAGHQPEAPGGRTRQGQYANRTGQ